jgi:L-asparagine permease
MAVHVEVAPADTLNAEQEGYKQSLGRRQVQMIAVGGAIGTGLFLGSASRLSSTGPALVLSYAFVGVIAFLLMRALGELVLHRPTSGAVLVALVVVLTVNLLSAAAFGEFEFWAALLKVSRS